MVGLESSAPDSHQDDKEEQGPADLHHHPDLENKKRFIIQHLSSTVVEHTPSDPKVTGSNHSFSLCIKFTVKCLHSVAKSLNLNEKMMPICRDEIKP